MVYITKVCGADDIAGPLVFGLEGWRDRASRMLRGHFRPKVERSALAVGRPGQM